MDLEIGDLVKLSFRGELSYSNPKLIGIIIKITGNKSYPNNPESQWIHVKWYNNIDIIADYQPAYFCKNIYCKI